MPTVLVLYYSRTGNTEEMAKSVEEGVKSEGIKAIRKKVTRASPKDLLKADAIILGSPNSSSLKKSIFRQNIDQETGPTGLGSTLLSPNETRMIGTKRKPEGAFLH